MGCGASRDVHDAPSSPSTPHAIHDDAREAENTIHVMKQSEYNADDEAAAAAAAMAAAAAAATASASKGGKKDKLEALENMVHEYELEQQSHCARRNRMSLQEHLDEYEMDEKEARKYKRMSLQEILTEYESESDSNEMNKVELQPKWDSMNEVQCVRSHLQEREDLQRRRASISPRNSTYNSANSPMSNGSSDSPLSGSSNPSTPRAGLQRTTSIRSHWQEQEDLKRFQVML